MDRSEDRVSPPWSTSVAALLGLLAVLLGAFGAHGLSERLAANETTAIWEKAVFYHLVHAVMMFVLAERSARPLGPWVCFLIGITIFSGTLYVLAITNLSWLGAITPVGGLSLIAGWAWLIVSSRSRSEGPS